MFVRPLCMFAVAALGAFSVQPRAFADGVEEYHLAVGDVVSFDFIDDALPSEQLTISSDGALNVPLLGSFKAVGLSVPEALSEIRKTFIDRQIFIDPRVALAVVSFRPIFVLGDVKSPGSFAYQPSLTVEQAVALAGGQSTGGATGEDRVVTGARLRGNLGENTVEIAREAVAAARVKAQLAGQSAVSEDNLPGNARDILNANILAALMPTEQQILDTEQGALEKRRGQLAAAVEEVNGAIGNLKSLAEMQKTVIESAQRDLERSKSLSKKGLTTLTDVSSVERELSSQQSRLLEVYNQMSTARRDLGELQRQLSDVTDTWKRTALSELQGHNAEIERLLAVRRSTEEQIVLLNTLAVDADRASASIAFNYQVRRQIGGKVVTQQVMLGDAVRSGDTVLVSIYRPGADPSIPVASNMGELLQ